MSKIIKTMKYKIISPCEIEKTQTKVDWIQFRKLLDELQYETYITANAASHELWHWYMGYSKKYNDIYKVYPNISNAQDIFNGYKAVDSYCYNELVAKKDTKSLSNNLSTTLASVSSKYSSPKDNDKKKSTKQKNTKKTNEESNYEKMLKGLIKPPAYKRNIPIDIHNKAVNKIIQIKDDIYKIKVSLVSIPYRQKLNEMYNWNLTSGIFEFLIEAKNSGMKNILDNVINNTYKLCACKIIKKNDKWGEFVLTYSFESEKPKELDKNKTLGVDLGIVKATVIQIWDESKQDWEWLNWNECILDGKELIHFRQKIEARRREMSKSLKVNNITNHYTKGKKGHGIKSRLKPLDSIKDKISKFRDTMNHKYSKYIVDMAIKHNCATIQMEDLTGFNENKNNKFLQNWSYYDLQNKIIQKAKEAGIEVIKVKPQYTSKRCSKCGCIHDDNRDCKKDQAKFTCVVCGYDVNADINAARNIALPLIDKIIEEQIELKA